MFVFIQLAKCGCGIISTPRQFRKELQTPPSSLWSCMGLNANLKAAGYRITSPATPSYNCFAWGGNHTRRWWQPAALHGFYWPEGIPGQHQPFGPGAPDHSRLGWEGGVAFSGKFHLPGTVSDGRLQFIERTAAGQPGRCVLKEPPVTGTQFRLLVGFAVLKAQECLDQALQFRTQGRPPAKSDQPVRGLLNCGTCAACRAAPPYLPESSPPFPRRRNPGARRPA